MALVNRKSRTSLMLSLQILFISIGVLSMAVILNLYSPAMVDFAANQIPVMWKSFASLLRPPYLYFVINGIIISIVASSRFQQKEGDEKPAVVPLTVSSADLASSPIPPPFTAVEPRELYLQSEDSVNADDFSHFHNAVEAQQEIIQENPVSPVIPPPCAVMEKREIFFRNEAAADDEVVISKLPLRKDWREIPSEYLLPAEKPLVSARFNHRKAVKSSPEGIGGGKALRRVAKPKRHETLENTWKMITEGRSMPLTRHLKKSDTLENRGREMSPGPGPDDLTPDLQSVSKFETFKDRTNNLPPPLVSSSQTTVRLKKEPSLGQDELNRRVEAFIRKFNEEMRLQRQESLNQYYEMINRGDH